jgi:hypothetical protein
MKYVKGFFLFWYDFLVGDSALLAIGGIAIIVAGYLLVQAHATVGAEVILPVLAIGTIVLSLPELRSRRR